MSLNKNKLEQAREKINEVDEEMIILFKERMKAVKDVLEYKKENGLPVLDSSREKEIIAKNLSLLNDEDLEEYYLRFFKAVLAASKDYQTNHL